MKDSPASSVAGDLQEMARPQYGDVESGFIEAAFGMVGKSEETSPGANTSKPAMSRLDIPTPDVPTPDTSALANSAKDLVLIRVHPVGDVEEEEGKGEVEAVSGFLFNHPGNPLPIDGWGSYSSIGLLAKNYFVGYNDGLLYDLSEDKTLAAKEASKVLVNSRLIRYIGWDGEGEYSLELEEGYELSVKGIDGSKIFLELEKDGQVVDTKVRTPLAPGATIADKTYYYSGEVGEAKGIVTIAVHLQTVVGWVGGTMVVVDGVWQISDVPVATPKVSGMEIVYHADYGSGIWTMSSEGTDQTQLTDHGWYAEVSPDGALIAFSDFYNNGIWVMDSDGSNQYHLTKSGSAPTWSPNGEEIAYHQGDTAGMSRSIWVMKADGSGQKQLSSKPGSFPKWSPVEDKILYHGEVNNGIWQINPDGTGEAQLISTGGYPGWSPDGSEIAYVSLADWCIWTMSADGSDQKKLTDQKGIKPSWSPDGTKIAYEDLAKNKGIRIISSDGSGDHGINEEGHAPEWFKEAGEEGCCPLGTGLDFTALPPGTLPPGPVTYDDLIFTVVWKEILVEGNSLWCYGSEENPPGVWHDSAVKLDFSLLPCRVCRIKAKVDSHGPDARLEGHLLNGGSQVVTCPGNVCTLTLNTTSDNPFVAATLSGQEAEWTSIRLG